MATVGGADVGTAVVVGGVVGGAVVAGAVVGGVVVVDGAGAVVGGLVVDVEVVARGAVVPVVACSDPGPGS